MEQLKLTQEWDKVFPQLRSNSNSPPARLPPPARILPQPGFPLSTLPAPGKRKGSRPYGRLSWFQETKHIARKTSSVPLVRQICQAGLRYVLAGLA